MPLRSVHITNYYHKNSGGISTSYNNLLAAAERHKRYIRLIVPGEIDAVEDVNEYAKIYYVPAKYSPVFDKRYRIMMPWQYMLADSAIRKILLDEKPDLIEVTDKYTLSMIGVMVRGHHFQQIGQPVMVHFSCERMDDNIGSFLVGGKIGEWIARRVMGNYNLPSFDYHIANSAYTADEFYRSYRAEDNPKRSEWFFNKCWQFFGAPRVPVKDRILVCPRGVDIWQFSPDRGSDEIGIEMRRKTGISDDAVMMLYAGRISPEKNIGLLVEMMKLLAVDPDHDYRLLVAGAGPQSEWLQQQSDKYCPGRIIQLGHLDKSVLSGYYAKADILCIRIRVSLLALHRLRRWHPACRRSPQMPVEFYRMRPTTTPGWSNRRAKLLPERFAKSLPTRNFVPVRPSLLFAPHLLTLVKRPRTI
ncbi:MAG: glycosyltransferase [Chloracidobacterium sp.]|nr:glycosyltransferase [Chloracidobacterium sp.]